MKEGSDSLCPIFVDLDGTFTKTDLLFESWVVALKTNLLVIIKSVWWFIKGKAYLKEQLAKISELDVSILPLNPEFESFLQRERKKGREIILATASNEKYAQQFCNQFELFDSYLASEKDTNLKGTKKLEKISEHAHEFAYAGNECGDFIIFERAKESFLVNPSRKAYRKSLNDPSIEVFDKRKHSLLSEIRKWIKQIRVQQWLKNSLIFVPLLVSGNYLDSSAVISALIGFFSFSFLASATYLVNDIFDLESDRRHPRKKYRPIAAGTLSIRSGMIVFFVLISASIILTTFTNRLFVFTLLLYLGMTLSYSFKLKHYFGMDVILLASMYTIRIFGGAAIIEVPLSFWLACFSMFLFFSLAMVKRCAEIKMLEIKGSTKAKGRDYSTRDYHAIMSFGVASAVMAVAMFSFYINSNTLTNQYQEPTLLWAIIPALGYWIMRMWIKTNRGEMHDDPIVFSIKDKGSLITIAAIVILTLIAQII